jgi:hypothetical protein
VILDILLVRNLQPFISVVCLIFFAFSVILILNLSGSLGCLLHDRLSGGLYVSATIPKLYVGRQGDDIQQGQP